MGGRRDERCRGCLGVTVDNLGDMIVDVLLANVPSASTLPGASGELGQHAWGLAMSEWLDKAGEAKRWEPRPSFCCTDHSEAGITSASTAGGCHRRYSFTTSLKEVNAANGRVYSCKHFQCWLILQNKTVSLVCWRLSCLNHELWQHSWLGDTVIYFMLRKCGFFSTVLYGNGIHWGVK